MSREEVLRVVKSMSGYTLEHIAPRSMFWWRAIDETDLRERQEAHAIKVLLNETVSEKDRI